MNEHIEVINLTLNQYAKAVATAEQAYQDARTEWVKSFSMESFWCLQNARVNISLAWACYDSAHNIARILLPNYTHVMNADHEAAKTRVNNNPELEEYRDLLINYDWGMAESEHENWIATAPLAEILNWAKAIRNQETQE